MKNKRILYLLWGEDVSQNNGIFLSQVLTQISTTNKLFSDTSILCIVGIPILKKRIILNWKEYNQSLKKLIKLFSENGIKLQFKNIPIFSRFNSTKKYFPFYSFLQKKYLYRIIKKNDINILHCRSYHATYLALRTKIKNNLDINIIFDARGIVPEEGIIKRLYSEDSDTYKFWKKIELNLIKDSDAVVTVSEPFTDHFRGIFPSEKIHTIYTSTDIDVFRKLDNKKELKGKFGLESASKILIYIGSIGAERWHTPKNLVEVYTYFRKAFDNTRLFVVTQTRIKKEIEELFIENDIGLDELLVKSSTRLEDTNEFLNTADYGVIPFREGEDYLNEIFGRVMMGSKTGEYLSAGLPVITNSKVGGVSEVIKKFSVGIIYQKNEIENLTETLKGIDADYQNISDKCVVVAQERFSTKKHAEQYHEIYNKLTIN